jgi:Bacterial PH domain
MRLAASGTVTLVVTASFLLAVVAGVGASMGGQAALLALSPALAILAWCLWRPRVELGASGISVRPVLGRTRRCAWSTVKAVRQRTIDPLWPTTYLELFSDRAARHCLLSINLNPLAKADRRALIESAERAERAQSSRGTAQT